MEKYVTATSLTGKQMKLLLKPEKTMREWMLDFLPQFEEVFGGRRGDTLMYAMIVDNKVINTSRQRHIKSGDLVNDQKKIFLVYYFMPNVELIGNLDPSDYVMDIDTCAICYDPMIPHSSGYDITYPLLCKHAFHYKCIIRDMRAGRNTCPICRRPHNNIRIPSEQEFPLD